MRIGILAVQGAFAEHEKILDQLNVPYVELRKAEDLDTPYDGLIFPGGESTVQGKLLKELGMFEPIYAQLSDGMPVLATCAGMILLASSIDNDDRHYFGTLPVSVKRNAYGRQLGSFHTTSGCKGIGDIPMTFIRAPYVSSVEDSVEVLSVVDEHIVAVQYKNQLAMSFHPELDDDLRIHQKFLKIVQDHAFL